MRIFTVTTFFPNSADPHRTVFVKNLVGAMRECCELIMVAPVPLAPPIPGVARWYARHRIARVEEVDGNAVLHPRFPFVPKIHWLTGLGYFVGLIGLLRRLKREHGPCLIHVHCAYPDAVGVALAARVLGLPYVVTAHGSDINVYAGRRALRPQIRWALQGAAGVIAVSDALAAKIEGLCLGRVKRMVRIPCAGFNPEMFHPRSTEQMRTELDLPRGARIVVYVGHLVPIKGVNFLVDAWIGLHRRAALEAATLLVIIGDGVERGELERAVAAGGVAANVRFTGAISQREVSRWVAAANVLSLPSLNEGMPNVVVEALASGVPVVATRVGGVPDLVSVGVNGLLVPSGDAAALADALHEALTRSWLPAQISQSVAHLTWRALAAKNCEFLESVVKQR